MYSEADAGYSDTQSEIPRGRGSAVRVSTSYGPVFLIELSPDAEPESPREYDPRRPASLSGDEQSS
jgi:hypothetical protein